MIRRRRREEDEEIELTEKEFGSISNMILGFFGISEENMETVKTILNMVKTTDYPDRTEIEISLKKIKVTITK